MMRNVSRNEFSLGNNGIADIESKNSAFLKDRGEFDKKKILITMMCNIRIYSPDSTDRIN